MSKKSRTTAKGHKIGPRIVRAWFDTVINPLLRALETEQRLLKERNWTWRFRPADLELIHPVRVHLEVDARDNLDQCLEFFPNLGMGIEEHDTAVSHLLENCKTLQQTIQENPALREKYEAVTSPEALGKLGVTVNDLFGAYPPADHLAVLAQYIVNNSSELPDYFAPARLWNQHRDAFMAIAEDSSIRPYRDAVDQAGTAALRTVERLTAILRQRRQELSLEHDVPYMVPAGSVQEMVG